MVGKLGDGRGLENVSDLFHEPPLHIVHTLDQNLNQFSELDRQTLGRELRNVIIPEVVEIVTYVPEQPLVVDALVPAGEIKQASQVEPTEGEQ